MVKKITQILIILIVIVISFCIYLSIYGISTNKFNNLVSEKILEKNKDFKIKLDQVKIFLNLSDFKLELKTNNPEIFFKGKEVKIKFVSTSLPLKSLIQKNKNIENIKFLTKKNDVKDIINLAKSFYQVPQLFILSKVVKSGLVTAEANINFDKNGNILKNYSLDGKIENLDLKLLNNKEVNQININFLIQDKNYLFYNSSSIYLNTKIKSNEIRILDINNKYFFEGDISNNKSEINLSEFLKPFKISFNLPNNNILLTSVSKFSFELSKKLKFSNFKIQSNLDIDNFKYSNSFLKNFLPGYRKSLSLQKNNIKINYLKDNFNLIGSSKININDDIDDLEYSIKNNNNKTYFNGSLNINKNAINFKNLNFTKKKNADSQINFDGEINKNKAIIINNIKFEQASNIIQIKKINFTKNKRINFLDEINLIVLNNNNIKSKLNIKRSKTNYNITSDNFDGTNLLDKILFSKNDGNYLSKFKNLNSKVIINIKKLHISKNDSLNDLNATVDVKKNQIDNLILSSKFSNNDTLKLSIVKNADNAKITTLTTKNAKPLVKKYKFIKGFEGGSLDFYSKSKDNFSRSNLNITDFKLKEVPALTKLLTLASLQGIADLLTGEGIRFNEFEMKFTNKNGLMTIEEIYSLGPSISILMDGYVQKDDLISLRGTLVPATTVNKVIGSIPLLGDILVGKKAGEGVFGVSFKIKGYPKNLKTSVNPIKTLTPRFITRTLENIKKTKE
tara:strand:- start:10784 stop:12985 length:2202 start_codon:yes stop_codon:yes gene_type:complete